MVAADDKELPFLLYKEVYVPIPWRMQRGNILRMRRVFRTLINLLGRDVILKLIIVYFKIEI